MADKKFWPQVNRLIEAKGTSLEKLAIACQVPLSTLNGWIKNNYFPSIVEGYKIARELGVSVEYLITGQENPSRKNVEAVRSLLRKAEELLKKMQR